MRRLYFYGLKQDQMLFRKNEKSSPLNTLENSKLLERVGRPKKDPFETKRESNLAKKGQSQGPNPKHWNGSPAAES